MPAEKSGGVLLGMTGLERALSCMSCFPCMHITCVMYVLHTHTNTHARARTHTHARTHMISYVIHTQYIISLSLSLSLSDTHTHTHEKQQQESNACFSRPSLMRERRRAWSFEAFKPCSSSSFLNKSVLTLFTRYPVSVCVCVCVCACV